MSLNEMMIITNQSALLGRFLISRDYKQFLQKHVDASVAKAYYCEHVNTN